MSSNFSAVGLSSSLEEDFLPDEIADDVDSKKEANDVEAWAMLERLGKEDSSTGALASSSHEPRGASTVILHAGVLESASRGVCDTTDRDYRRLMQAYEAWVKSHGFCPLDESVFDLRVFAADAPKWICLWILDRHVHILERRKEPEHNHRCDEINMDGTKRPHNVARATYSYAMKMRSSMTYGYGRIHERGTELWRASENGEWRGNPSLSTQVGKYMVSLRRRKVRSGDVPMSARAVNPDVLKALWEFNHIDENWVIRPYAPTRRSKNVDTAAWGGGRTRRLLHAGFNIAFWCLLRSDELLRIQWHDISPLSPTCIKLVLPWRKTSQNGDCKPFYLHMLGEEDAYMCPIRALADWLETSRKDTNASGYVFRRMRSGDRINTENVAMTSAMFLELFRLNLIDIGHDPWPYGTHSFRRGGCQWLSSGCRWPLRRICDWGGWSMNFNSLTIVKYLISWNDDPLERREEYLNPHRAPAKRCFSCGRCCHCA